jgi:hypothetical protein
VRDGSADQVRRGPRAPILVSPRPEVKKMAGRVETWVEHHFRAAVKVACLRLQPLRYLRG